MATDPRETTNRIAADRGRATEMRARLDAWRGGFTPVTPTDSAEELDPEIQRRLQDLGYIEA